MRVYRICTPFLLAFLLTLSTACTKDPAGTAVRFNAFATGFGQRNADTKTAYSERVTSGAERIDWSDGDLLMVWSDNETATDLDDHSRCSEYKVVSHNTFSATVSRAFLMPSDGGNGMQWGTGDHTFFAMYPSPRTPGLEGASFQDGAMTFPIPAEQNATPAADPDRHLLVCAAPMQYAPMLCQSATVAAGTREVNLTFIPQYTAYEFTVAKGENESVTLTGFRLTAADVDVEGHANGCLTGSFQVPIDGYNDATKVSISDGGRRITMDWSSAPVVLDAQNPAIRVTVHAVPQAVSSLTIGFDCTLATVEDGVAKTVDTTCSLLLQTDEHIPLGFAPYKKYCIDHLYIPVLIHTETDDSIIWNYSISVLDNIAWWIAAGLDDIGWPDLTVPPGVIPKDPVAWWSGLHIMDAVAWADQQVRDPSTQSDDRVSWWEDTYLADFVSWETFSHAVISSDAPAVLRRNETCRRTVTAYNTRGEAYPRVVIVWSVNPESAHIARVGPYTGIVTGLAPGNAVITATVTPDEGTPVVLSYPVTVIDE